MAIETLAKPAGIWCRHCGPGNGCRVYPNRPAECRDYSCLWLFEDRLGPHWKPSQSSLVLTVSEDGIEIRCDPDFPDAWRKPLYRDQIRQWAVAGETHDVTVLVISGEQMVLVTPEREFDLGVVGPDQRIVREIEGTRVVGVRVIAASEVNGAD
jgi:hypothetical protein